MLTKLQYLMIHGLDQQDQLHHQDQVDQEDQEEDLVETQVEVVTIQITVSTAIQTTTTVVEDPTSIQIMITEEEAPVEVEDTTLMNHPTPVVEAPVVDLMNQLTGSQEVWYLQSKTKNNAVAAGHSRPLEISLLEEQSNTTLNQLITPSNNSLIVQDLSVTMDAKVELWTLLSNMLKLHHLRPQLTTHTELKMVPACTLNHKELELLLVSLTSKKTVSMP